MLPNFLCIGLNKAGTSWLYWKLKEHPKVWMGRFKEIHYFDQKWLPKKRPMVRYHLHNIISEKMKWILDHKLHKNTDYSELENLRLFAEILNYDPLKPFDIKWYEKLFSSPYSDNKKIIGDITPDYFPLSLAGIKDVRNTLGKIPILLIIRDPLERLLSQLRMNNQRNRLNLHNMSYSDWKIFLDDDENIYEYFDISSLRTYIPLWQDIFSDNFFCLPYSLIKENPKKFMREIERNLLLSEFNYSDLNQVIHSTKNFNFHNDVLKILKEKLEPEYKYLEKNFENYI